MRGEIAFYRGDYAQAVRFYRRAGALDPKDGSLAYRWAVYHAKTGRPDLAAADFDRALAAAELQGQFRANVELQKGILLLEGGRWDEALARFRRADAIFPGHWLVQEHIAETLTLLGRTVEAERMYADIVRRTGHPEFMDQLAAIAQARGDAAAARAWSERACPERAAAPLLPEAAYGHALDHYLAAGDPARALEIARANHAARPFGESKVALAEALLQAGQPQAARGHPGGPAFALAHARGPRRGGASVRGQRPAPPSHAGTHPGPRAGARLQRIGAGKGHWHRSERTAA